MSSVAEQINQVINNLADKLGVAASQLYSVLIKQSYIDGVNGIFALLLGMALVSTPLISYKVVTKKNKNNEYISRYWDVAWVGFWMINIIVWTVGIVMICLNFTNILTAFMNPDWYALQKIMSYIK